MSAIKKIGILTSGGDAPGMNTAIKAITKYANFNGIETVGIKGGFRGIMECDFVTLTDKDVDEIAHLGGTILHTSRYNGFNEIEHRAKAAEILNRYGLNNLIVLGGNGSFKACSFLTKEHGLNIVGIPSTIDNDIPGTDSIGFDTAINNVINSILKIKDSAISHSRTHIIEVMGKDSGNIAFYTFLAGEGDIAIVPEHEFDYNTILNLIVKRRAEGKNYNIILLAEGTGQSADLTKFLNDNIDVEIKELALGHVQRGGPPSAIDRINAIKLAVFGVDILLKGGESTIAGIKNGNIVTIPFSTVWQKENKISEEEYRMASIISNSQTHF